MAIQDTFRKAGLFKGDGETTEFAFDFKVFKPEEVGVFKSAAPDELAACIVLAYEKDFTVALNADQENSPGGTVTLLSPLEKGLRLAILSRVTPEQTMVLTNHGGFYPSVLNDSADRAIALIQEILEELSRCVRLRPTDAITAEQLRDRLFCAMARAEAAAKDAEEAARICKTIWELIHRYSFDIPHIVPTIQAVRDYPYDGYFWVPGMAPTESTADITNRVVTIDGETKSLGEWFAQLIAKTNDATDSIVVVDGVSKTLGTWLTEISDALAGIKKFLESIDIPRIVATLDDVEDDEHEGYFWVPDLTSEDTDFLAIYLAAREWLELYPMINRDLVPQGTEPWAYFLLARGVFDDYPIIDANSVDEDANILTAYLTARGN